MKIPNIHKSKLRKSLLNTFCSNPQSPFYVRELERLIKFSAGNICKELTKLEQEGVLVKEKKANLIYFRLNIAYPYLHILFKMLGLSDSLLEKITNTQNVEIIYTQNSVPTTVGGLDVSLGGKTA